MRYWAYINNEVAGPFEENGLAEIPGITPETMVCPEAPPQGQKHQWFPAKTLETFSKQKPHSAEKVDLPPSQSGRPSGRKMPSDYQKQDIENEARHGSADALSLSDIERRAQALTSGRNKTDEHQKSSSNADNPEASYLGGKIEDLSERINTLATTLTDLSLKQSSHGIDPVIAERMDQLSNEIVSLKTEIGNRITSIEEKISVVSEKAAAPAPSEAFPPASITERTLDIKVPKTPETKEQPDIAQNPEISIPRVEMPPVKQQPSAEAEPSAQAFTAPGMSARQQSARQQSIFNIEDPAPAQGRPFPSYDASLLQREEITVPAPQKKARPSLIKTFFKFIVTVITAVAVSFAVLLVLSRQGIIPASLSPGNIIKAFVPQKGAEQPPAAEIAPAQDGLSQQDIITATVKNHKVSPNKTLEAAIMEISTDVKSELVEWNVRQMDENTYSVTIKVLPSSPNGWISSYRFDYNNKEKTLTPINSEAQNLLNSLKK